jgi:hypothetical protein
MAGRVARGAKSIDTIAETVKADSVVQTVRNVHDFVRDIPFGFAGSFYKATPLQVIEEGVGFCNLHSESNYDEKFCVSSSLFLPFLFSPIQGNLFVELLQSCGIRARLHWVQLDKNILSGIILPPGSVVDHVFSEIHHEETDRWVRCDSYIVDKPLFDAAKSKLLSSNKLVGFGIHSRGSCECAFPDDSLSQGFEDIITKDFNEFVTPAEFYSSEKGANKLGGIFRVFVVSNFCKECKRGVQ